MTIEIDLDAIERAALAATPGPWMRLFGERTVYDRMEDGCRGIPIVRADACWGTKEGLNLDYITAANPAIVLELVRRLREAEKDAARYRWLRDTANGSQPISAFERCEWWQDKDTAIDVAMGEPK